MIVVILIHQGEIQITTTVYVLLRTDHITHAATQGERVGSERCA